MREAILVRTVACTALLVGMSACGEDDAATAADDSAAERLTLAPADETEGHDHGTHDHGDEAHGHGADGSMAGTTGDADATPANELPDAVLREGHFHLLDGAPKGSPDLGGHAYLARTDDGTTLSIDLTGLEPGANYMSHLHAGTCEPNSGGDHFKFDPSGSDEPPNEVHLAFTAAGDGTVATTITNDNPRSEGAKSMVLHLPDGTKFACADLAG